MPDSLADAAPVTSLATGAQTLSLEAPAKVNLDLRVVGRREDGYHLVETTILLLELADRLLLFPGDSGLRVEGERAGGVPPGAQNLAWRGLLAGLGGEPEMTCLALDKRIPVAAGLGGGSSDAAAAWRLGRRWRGALEEPEGADVEELAGIGADVPFFASRAPAARVEGIGERVAPVAPPSLEVLLVHPPFGLSTADVFAELRPAEWGSGANDLLPPALRLEPRIGGLLEQVRAAGGEARLTGSGPTVFAASDDTDRIRHVAERLRTAGLSVSVTRTRQAAASIQGSSQEE